MPPFEIADLSPPPFPDLPEVTMPQPPWFDPNQFPWNVLAPVAPGPAGPCGPSEPAAL